MDAWFRTSERPLTDPGWPMKVRVMDTSDSIIDVTAKLSGPEWIESNGDENRWLRLLAILGTVCQDDK